MRICMDGTPLLVRSAGVKTYLYHWLRSLQASSAGYHVTVFPRIGPLLKLDHEHSVRPLLPTAFHLAALEVLNRGRRWLPAGKPDDGFPASNFVRSLPRNSPRIPDALHVLTTRTLPY